MAGRANGKVAIITGAGQGQGAATAKLLAREGAKVVVVDWDEGVADRTVDAIRSGGGECLKVIVDAATPDGAREMFDAALDEYGNLDILHNQVFGMEAGLLEHLTLDGWNETFRLTAVSTFLGIKFGAPIMREHGGGAIVNTASVSGLCGDPGLGAYSASKAAVISLTKTAAAEFARSNIRVNCICPGPVNSESFKQNFGEAVSKTWLTSSPHSDAPPPMSEIQRDALRKAMDESMPRGFVIEPEEIANLVLFLATTESSVLNGAIVVADTGKFNLSGAPSMVPLGESY